MSDKGNTMLGNYVWKIKVQNSWYLLGALDTSRKGRNTLNARKALTLKPSRVVVKIVLINLKMEQKNSCRTSITKKCWSKQFSQSYKTHCIRSNVQRNQSFRYQSLSKSSSVDVILHWYLFSSLNPGIKLS